MNDMFRKMWDQQESFLKSLVEKRGFPHYPVDLSEKSGQSFIKNLIFECGEELFEANRELKNGKNHKITESLFNREAYVEELSDAFHYLIGILQYSGVSIEEIYEAYMKKGEINLKRINDGY